MLFCISDGADLALLFTAEQDEPHRASRRAPQRLDLACGIDHGGHSRSVVLGAGPRIPTIQMSSKDHYLIGRFTAADLTHYLRYFHSFAAMIRELQSDTYRTAVQQPLEEQVVLSADLGYRKVLQGASWNEIAHVLASIQIGRAS